MAEALYLVRRTSQGVNDDRNRVREVLINEDDGQTNAQIITATIAALNANEPVETGAEDIYPAGYFDEVIDIDDLSGTTDEDNLRTDGDFIAFGPEVTSVKTAAV